MILVLPFTINEGIEDSGIGYQLQMPGPSKWESAAWVGAGSNVGATAGVDAGGAGDTRKHFNEPCMLDVYFFFCGKMRPCLICL